MASEVALSQDGQRPNELGNEPKQEHVSTRPSLEDQSNEGKPPKNTALIIFCISCITFISCYLGGLVTVSVPAISKDLSLDPGVELWPVSIAAIANTFAALSSWWKIPRSQAGDVSWHMLVFGIDWVGAVAASAGLGLLSYALSLITGDINKAHEASTIICFSLSGVLLIFFVLWQSFQERRNKPTLIWNSLWKNLAFTCTCVNEFMIWGAFNAFEQVINLFFQNAQDLSRVETAIRFIPTPITGQLTALTTRFVLHRCRADAIINITTIISCVSPLIMALVNPIWVYWRCAYVAICLKSITADSLFTVSNILIAGVFPAETQGLAAGAFNTASQIGKSFGLAIVALISNQVTDQQSQIVEKGSPEALIVGYRAAFWTLFGMNVASLVVSLFGLRKVGNIGKKKTQ
ncbi:hypothetical protein AFLA_012212 [Aspergillus flavus NRRL3357]|nr:hypothetical protein AFLA_012212 [Aspergillus flavus NRRL3357]